ncbi:MAG: GFA family protein [Rhodobacteraceae bacterium]|nr:GFA family protein [Paracoccaceae bacterium]
MTTTGKCLCGAVHFTITAPPTETGACHCNMCRRWSGGVYLGVQVAPDNIKFAGAENITTYASSEWAERGFCKTCGSSLYYRVTAPGSHNGTYHMGLGTFDDPSRVNLTGEIFIDEKPQGYAFAGDTHKMTGAEVFAMFAPPE